MSLPAAFIKRQKSNDNQKTKKITNDTILLFLKTLLDNFKTLREDVEKKSNIIKSDFKFNLNFSTDNKRLITFSVDVTKNINNTFNQKTYFTNDKKQRQLINVTVHTVDKNNSLPVYETVLEILQTAINQQECCSQFALDFFD